MSNYKLVTVNQKFIAETVARTGSEELLDKSTRSFVGLYDEKNSWYIPLRANIGKKRPKDSFFETPFKTNNPHFKRPALDYQKALFVPKESIIEIKNTLPKEQHKLILKEQNNIQQKFEDYLLKVSSLDKRAREYLWSTIPLFPDGIKLIKEKVHTTEIKQTIEVDKSVIELKNIQKIFDDRNNELAVSDPLFVAKMELYKDNSPKQSIQVTHHCKTDTYDFTNLTTKEKLQIDEINQSQFQKEVKKVLAKLEKEPEKQIESHQFKEEPEQSNAQEEKQEPPQHKPFTPKL